MVLKEKLVENFKRYVAITTQSNPNVSTVPSTDGQFTLANLLKEELIALGFENVKVDEHAIVTGKLLGNTKGDAIGFVSHLDTVDVGLSPDIHPQILHYEGGDVCLNEKEGIYIKLSEHPELNDYVGDDIIFSDGTSVLGADNKAAMANIMTAFAYIVENKLKHPDIYIAFVPDEEIGLKGSKLLNLDEFKVDYAYTIDSCKLGEIVYETFNAAAIELKIKGVSAHPMSAKDVLVNPLLIANDYMNMYDKKQTPENTEKMQGYWWFVGCKSDSLYCTLKMHIRDFDKANYERRKEYVRQTFETLKLMHPKAELELTIEDVYANIANNVTDKDKPVAMLYEAAKSLGIKAITIAMRGGTDGSALSAKGIVTPNFFTGAHNFHSYAEFLPLNSFEKSCKMTLKLIEMACSEDKKAI